MNKVALVGRLTANPELRKTRSGQSIVSFTLAVDKQLSKDKKEQMREQNKPTADFPRIQVWGAMADNCNRYLSKGSQCAVSGRIQTGAYEDKDTGKMIYTTDVVADNVEFLGGNRNNQSNDNDFFDDDFTEIEDDGRIPF